MRINPKEIESVSQLKPFDRYKYLIKKVADSEAVYSLSNDLNELAVAEVGGCKVVSLWSAEEYAQKFIVDEWRNYKIHKILLAEIKSSFIPFVNSHNLLINVFPVGTKSGFVVAADEFLVDLESELNKYE